MANEGDKYKRLIVTDEGELMVDVYDVLDAFEITCPALAHALKKALCTGTRGVKGFDQDIDELIGSLLRAKTLRMNRAKRDELMP